MAQNLEVADIFRSSGPAWRKANAGHISLPQLKVMSAIESCRTSALGGHVAQCQKCDHMKIAYNSCRNRHCPERGGRCPKMPGCSGQGLVGCAGGRAVAGRVLSSDFHAASADQGHCLSEQESDLQPFVQGFRPDHVDDCRRCKASWRQDWHHISAPHMGLGVVSETRIRTMTHHPHVHMIVPGGGLCPDGKRWIACKPGFFLPVRVLSRLFRRLFLTMLAAAHDAAQLKFFGAQVGLSDAQAFADFLAPLRSIEWVVYAKRPFAGPESVLAYLSRYTHRASSASPTRRVAISNSRLLKLENGQVTFKWKDYRTKGPERQKTMTVSADEFIRRFLTHVLPRGFHRIRHYGLFANAMRADNIAKIRELLNAPATTCASEDDARDSDDQALAQSCPCCGGPMVIIEVFEQGCKPRPRPPPPKRLDSS